MKKIIAVISAVLCLTMLLSVTALAAGDTVSFGGQARRSGDSVTFQVSLSGQGVHSAQLAVTYDASSLTLTSAALGGSVSGAEVTSLDTDTAGEVEMGFAGLESVDPGVILELTFKAPATASVTVEVKEYAIGVGEGVNITDYGKYTITESRGTSTGGTAPAPSGPDPTVTTGDTADGDGGTTTETSAKPPVTTGGGKSSSTVSEEIGNEIVRQVEENDSDTAVIAPDFPGGATKAEVTIPGSTVSELGRNTDADLRVETPAADVTIPNGALESLGGSGDVTVYTEISGDTVTINVTAGGKAVSGIPGGMKVNVPLNDGEVAVIVAPDGTETVIPKSIVENGVTSLMLDGPATVKVINNSKSFTDVNTDDWFSGAVKFASSHELFSGTGDGSTFEPRTFMDRGMLATVLWRLESEAETDRPASFPDVPAGKWYAPGVAWAGAAGVIKGTDKGEFEPERSVTRQEMAVMIYQYAEYIGVDVTNSASLSGFTDSGSVAGWADEAVRWAVSAGILQGSGGSLNPTGTTTRAEVATVLQRLVRLIVK